jgi:hypothetical protein
MPTWVRVPGEYSYTGAFQRLVSPLGGPAGAVLNRWGLEFASSGTVDTNAPLRYQYNITDATVMMAYVKVNFDAADVAAYPGKFLTVTLYAALASSFAPGVVPTPSQIIANATVTGRGTSSRTTAGDLAMPVLPVPAVSSAWAPNEKWWVLVTPTAVTNMSASVSPSNDTPIGAVNTLGRAVSVWTNRTPSAPVVLTPENRITVFAGGEVNFSFRPAGGDVVTYYPGDSRPYTFYDMAGVQMQYAPAPTPDNPSPEWTDIPITNTLGTATGRGWHIKDSISEPANDGAKAFWETAAIKIRCGADSLAPGTANLPSGNWQVRIRTFDFGHPFPYSVSPIYPLNDNTRSYTPSTYPAVNTSPWSEPVFISVTTQVPPPILLTPTDGLAFPNGSAIDLVWQYRNTHVPPFAQASRTIQIKRVDEEDWTTASSGASGDHSATVTPGVPDAQYMVDGGFEAGTTGGWTTDWPGAATANVSGNVHSGTKALATTPNVVGSPGVQRTFDILPGHNYFDLSGWMHPGSGSVTLSRLRLDWLDQEVPTGAVKVQIVTSHVNFTGSTVTAPRIDDFSLIGKAIAGPPTTFNYPFEPGVQYMWRVQVTDTDGVTSEYSEPEYFWIVPEPDSGEVRPVPTSTIEGATLGCGKHRVEVFRRGGRERVGELTGIVHVDWERKRDDVSTAQVKIMGWDVDCGNLLAQLQTWAYELRITRDNGYSRDRVWEGPITLLTYEVDKVTIDAKDVMAYAYRRIIKQAINDSKNGRTVVARAVHILQNAFAPDDPNVLAYMRPITNLNDSMQYRSIPAYSRTAFEEIDDMAANSGLDYGCVGRAIVVWGTRSRLGTLPEFTDDNLGSPPIVSEYGMNMANRYAVSDGNGIWGEATRLDEFGMDETYGLVEMLSSTWASDAENEEGTYTQAGVETVIESFEGFAERSIENRYPPPVIVRVPDNTTLNPNTVLSIQQLVPGVVVPLRSTGTLREVVADQKLDSIKVIEDSGNETISITLSPFNYDETEPEVPA